MLSDGEKQLLALARVLVRRPDIAILDEATSVQDSGSQESMMELFRDERVSRTVISVGHRKKLAEYHRRGLMLTRRAEIIAVPCLKHQPPGDPPSSGICARLMDVSRATGIKAPAARRTPRFPIVTWLQHLSG